LCSEENEESSGTGNNVIFGREDKGAAGEHLMRRYMQGKPLMLNIKWLREVLRYVEGEEKKGQFDGVEKLGYSKAKQLPEVWERGSVRWGS
jgi:hypothetical protein